MNEMQIAFARGVGLVEDGAALLDELRTALVRYVALPHPAAADAITLWIAATHAQPAWEHAARLVLTSPEKRCGKSRTMDVVAATCHKPLATVNATVAAVVRSLGDDPPTLLIDEADTIWGTRRQADNNEDLRGIVNSGHHRGQAMIRWDITTRSLESLSTFGMVCLAAIGSLPATIEDRAVVVRMRRRAPNERVAPYRTRRDGPGLNDLRGRLAVWVELIGEELRHAEPDMPVEDRAADTWEPLVAIADAAGGDWPGRARRAAVAFVAEAEEADAEMSASLRLVGDIRDVFSEMTVTFLSSNELLQRLRKIEDSRWDDLTSRALADRLRRFGIRPGRDTAGNVRGYRLDAFVDTFTRYLPTPRQKPSEASETAPDLGERSDALRASDTSNRQTISNRQTETAGQAAYLTGLTVSDAPIDSRWPA